MRLKVFGIGERRYAIGIGRKMIGRVETDDGLWFVAHIGPIKAKGIDPARAAEACMAKFNRS